jgi:hypothetical protein
MSRCIRSLSLVATILAILSATAGAQTKADKKFQQECEKAAKTIARGNPEKKIEAAFGTLETCRGTLVSEGLAAGLLTYTDESDVNVLQQFMLQLDSWRDAAVLQAAITVAMNSGANGTARVFAVRHLLILSSPYTRYVYAGLIAGETTRIASDGMSVSTYGCGTMVGSERGNSVGTPLPADYESRIRETLAALIASPSTPVIVKNAARCGMR